MVADRDRLADRRQLPRHRTAAGQARLGDAGGAGEAAYIDAVVGVSEDPTTTDEQERCFAQAFMTSIGVEGMVEAGVSPDDIRNEPDASPAKQSKR